MPATNSTDIDAAVQASSLTGFTGQYRELGGGEVNDTFVLDCGDDTVVLRIARYPEVKNLHREARALRALRLAHVPKLIYYDESHEINGRSWILESYITGEQTERLSAVQYRSLGTLLAKIHQVRRKETEGTDYWELFAYQNKFFGSADDFLAHPDQRLRRLNKAAKTYLDQATSKLEPIRKSLVHNDVSLNNMIVNGDSVSLIDWEFSKYSDPMSDFAANYYDDMEYNRGRWRVKITTEQKAALFEGYRSAGGTIDEERLTMWMIMDKLGSAIFLYWRLHQSDREATDEQAAQNRLDLANLIGSLEKSF